MPKLATTRFSLILTLFFFLHLLAMEMGDSQTNNNRFCCKVCDRKFTSGQALGGHVKAHNAVSDGQRLCDLRSSLRSERRREIKGDCSSEEEDMANWLVMLSAADEEEGENEVVVGGAQKSCGSAVTGENQRRIPPEPPTPSCGFECNGCKKVFTSHQALGGHRASHKKVKGCFATTDKRQATKEDSPVKTNTVMLDKKKGKKAVYEAHTHECTVCRRVFSSGQALGGHKRCHWLTGSNLTDATYSAEIHQHLQLINPVFGSPEKLHFNLPATPSPYSILHIPPMEQIHTITTHCLSDYEILKNKDYINKRMRFNGISEDLEDGEDEKKGKLNITKLTEVNDLKMEGQCSSWLQVGIGSFSESNGTSGS